jgi:hypothetical protein
MKGRTATTQTFRSLLFGLRPLYPQRRHLTLPAFIASASARILLLQRMQIHMRSYIRPIAAGIFTFGIHQSLCHSY